MLYEGSGYSDEMSTFGINSITAMYSRSLLHPQSQFSSERVHVLGDV